MFFGGKTKSMGTIFRSNTAAGYYNAYNMFVDNNGNIVWGYTMFYSWSGQYNHMATMITMFGTDGFLYSVVNKGTNPAYSYILKQTYTHGEFVAMRTINSTAASFYSNAFVGTYFTMVQHPTDFSIFYSITSSNYKYTNFIFKLDPTTTLFKQPWFSFMEQPTAATSYTGYYASKIITQGGSTYLFSTGYITRPEITTKVGISKINPADGSLVALKYLNCALNQVSY